MPVEPADLDNLKDAINTHIDDTILPIQKQVDEQQKSLTDLYEKNTDTQVTLAAIPGAIDAVDIKHDGQHEVIKSSAKTAYLVIGAVIAVVSLVLTAVAIFV